MYMYIHTTTFQNVYVHIDQTVPRLFPLFYDMHLFRMNGSKTQDAPPPKNKLERVIGTNCNYMKLCISKGKNRSGLSKDSQALMLRRPPTLYI